MIGPRLIILVEPARRHRCEYCGEIFECHLCGINETHPVHIDRPNNEESDGKFFVCEECCADPEKRYQVRDAEIMDMLTGKCV